MSMIEDIRYLNETLGYSREDINKIIGFESATVAPVGEVKTEPEQKVETKVEPQGITLDSLGIKQAEITEKVDESPKENSAELLSMIKSLQEQIQSMNQTTATRFENLQKAQQASNTTMQVDVLPIKTSGELLDALSN